MTVLLEYLNPIIPNVFMITYYAQNHVGIINQSLTTVLMIADGIATEKQGIFKECSFGLVWGIEDGVIIEAGATNFFR